mgnify:CR=1 FL=1
MKYAVITSKHHEGFTLFDSKFTDYKATNTPYGKDLLKMWVDAFRAEGLKVGFYYSLIDWHHPEYTIDRVHPQSANTQEEYDALNKDRRYAIMFFAGGAFETPWYMSSMARYLMDFV